MNKIDDETIDNLAILAKLSLSDEEREQAKKDIARMLSYIDKMKELNTEGIEPMTHFSVPEQQTIFREDIVTNGDESKNTIRNAPKEKDNMFEVPRTID